jgi:hypothetical protein
MERNSADGWRSPDGPPRISHWWRVGLLAGAFGYLFGFAMVVLNPGPLTWSALLGGPIALVIVGRLLGLQRREWVPATTIWLVVEGVLAVGSLAVYNIVVYGGIND